MQLESINASKVSRLFSVATIVAEALVLSSSAAALAQDWPPKDQGPSGKYLMRVPPELEKRIRTPLNEQSKQQLLDVIDKANRSSGAIFEGETSVQVKAPLLTALITLNKQFDPFAIDTRQQREISLRDVLATALQNNLNIKIDQSKMDEAKWNYRGALGQFLPSLANTTSVEGIGGKYASPGGIVLPINNYFVNNSVGFSQPVFTGGKLIYTARFNKHNYKASQYALQGTTYDVFLQATKYYYELALNEVLLQIRIKAVEVSKALVIVQQDMYERGVNTKLDVLEAMYQLSRDRQDLIKQQIARRESAIKLSTALNLDPEIDLTTRDKTLTKTTLVDDELQPSDLLQIAISSRPELKKFEELRQAALDQIKIARSALSPQASVVGSVIATSSRAASLSSASNQQTPLASGGNGITSVSAGGVPLDSSSNNSSKHPTGAALFVIGLQANWQLGGLGVPEIAQINAAKANARKVQYEFSRELADVRKEVRDAHLATISNDNLIRETSDAIRFAEESLRVAEYRLQDGIGTYLEVIQAQKNYTDALIAKARALIDYNTSEAELLRALGRIEQGTLLASEPLKK